jgi:hypothetical protein
MQSVLCRSNLSRVTGNVSLAGMRANVYVDGFTLLCRRRHKRFYADLLVMPMSGVLLQVRCAFWFSGSAYS